MLTSRFVAAPGPPGNTSGHSGHLTLWGVVIGVVVLVALTGVFLFNYSRRKR